MLKTLKELCGINGVSGYEDEVRNYIEARVSAYADEMYTDTMGNLIVYKKGKSAGKKVMLAAHMDEVGIIVTDFTDEGYLKFACVGGIDRRVIIGKTVYIGDRKIFGVIGNKAVHLVKKDERSKIPSLDDMYIDIGAATGDQARELVQLGDVGAFAPDVFEFGNGFLKAKAIDDRIGCAVMIKLIGFELPVDCWFVFTVQEEVGTRGAITSAYRIEPDVALILEGTTAADLPGVQGNKRICSPGKGIVIPFMDGGTVYDRELYSHLTSLADDNDITWQTKSYIAGGTDASAIQRSRGGVRVIGISAALRNVHSPACVGNIEDFYSMEKLARLFLDTIGEI